MIHYHGTPVGGKRGEILSFLKGRHALVPFIRQDHLAEVAELCQSFVFDNGAFSVWKRGGTLDVPGYLAWVREWCRHPGFDWALIPDVIDGDEQANDELLSAFQEAGLSRYGVPVWHLHESLDRLSRLCEQWPTVALGSSGQWRTPGTKDWWLRMEDAMSAACDPGGRPRARLHGLRMLNPKVFSRLPLSSADSTNAAVNQGSLKRFGTYAHPSAGQRAAIIADRIEAHTSSAVWVPPLSLYDITAEGQ
jgi:hypothetical protein